MSYPKQDDDRAMDSLETAPEMGDRGLALQEMAPGNAPVRVEDVQTSTWFLLSRLWLSSQDNGLDPNPYLM